MTKRCTRCTQSKFVEMFHRRKNGQYRTWCKPCHAEYRLEWSRKNKDRLNAKARNKYKQNPQKERSRKLKQWYGVTQEQYDSLHLKQNGRCAVCNKTETHKVWGKTSQLSLDHDHLTGRVRGLLCHSCNSCIGYGKESPTLLRNAASYLENHHPNKAREMGLLK